MESSDVREQEDNEKGGPPNLRFHTPDLVSFYRKLVAIKPTRAQKGFSSWCSFDATPEAPLTRHAPSVVINQPPPSGGLGY